MTYLLAPLMLIAGYIYAPAVLLGWNGGHVGWVLIPAAFAMLIATSVYGLRRRALNARPRLWIPVTLLPAIWLFIVIWGFALAVPPGSQVQRGSWVGDTPMVAVALSLLASIFFIVYQRGSRLFLTCYSIMMLYITVAAWFLAAMEVTGTWI
jgi:hypothetical protein